ncbi:MAG TPA: hypothetical protein VK036_03435 [Wenzhouxiangella sp.]|nr:hypothetical protein [Wenzhouxiangella sp.]
MSFATDNFALNAPRHLPAASPLRVAEAALTAIVILILAVIIAGRGAG